MAIAAHRQLLQHHQWRLHGRDHPEAPANGGGVLDGIRKGQVHFAVEERRSHLVRGGPDRDVPGGQSLGGPLALEPDHGHDRRRLARPALDLLPNSRFRPPFGLWDKTVDPPLTVGKFDCNQPQVRASILLIPAKGRSADLGREQGPLQRVLDHQPARRCLLGQRFQHLLRVRSRSLKQKNHQTHGDDSDRRARPQQEVSSGLSHEFLTLLSLHGGDLLGHVLPLGR